MKLGIIPARYASTRFPGKPLANLLGRPMILWTLERARASRLLDYVYVATDDERIFNLIKTSGGNVIMTGQCESGSDRCWEALQKIEQDLNQTAEIVINIQGDEPLVDPRNIDLLIETLLNAPVAIPMVALASPIKTSEELICRATTKVVFDQNHDALYFSRAVIPHSKTGQISLDRTKQRYYKNCGMYGYRRDFLREFAIHKRTPLQIEEDLEQLKTLEMGYRIRMGVTDHAEGGIDLPEQLEELNQRLKEDIQ